MLLMELSEKYMYIHVYALQCTVHMSYMNVQGTHILCMCTCTCSLFYVQNGSINI